MTHEELAREIIESSCNFKGDLGGGEFDMAVLKSGISEALASAEKKGYSEGYEKGRSEK